MHWLVNGEVPLFRFPENEKRSPKESEMLCRFFCYGLENSLLLILQKANEIQVESDFNVFE